MKLIVCWLGDESEQVLKEMGGRLTKEQKKELKEKVFGGFDVNFPFVRSH